MKPLQPFVNLVSNGHFHSDKKCSDIVCIGEFKGLCIFQKYVMKESARIKLLVVVVVHTLYQS